jgi:triphosphatase
MDIEIELKFLVSQNVDATFAQVVNNLIENLVGASVEESTVHLKNTYFDTDDHQMRKHDCGLRTRSTNGVWEQTIKTAGKVVGGLHQRPEYNVPIVENKVQLNLFDPAILPQGMTIMALQSALIPLFTTNFERRIWRIKNAGFEFELVFDVGHISCNDQQLPICEVELELVKGDTNVLFDFSKALVKSVSKGDNTIRLGVQSKAARGYQLFNGSSLKEKVYLGQVPLEQQDSREIAFIKVIEYGLAFMLHHEQCFIDSPSLTALRRFTDGAALIRHAMWLFSSVVSGACTKYFRLEIKWILHAFDWVEHSKQLKALMSKTGKYRKRLDLSKTLSALVDEEAGKAPLLDNISQFFAKPRYNRFILDLSQWLINKDWQQDSPSGDIKKASESLPHAANELLNNSWQSLLSVMPRRDNLKIDDYIFHHKQLKRSLLTGSCLGGLYLDQKRDEFRMPWLDLSQGIDELKTLHLLQRLATQVDAPECRTTLSWLEQQIESLLLAMEQSRMSALKMRTYWSGV